MNGLIMFVGFAVALGSLAFNEKWYTKFLGCLAGIIIAALPIIMVLMFGQPQPQP